MPLKLSVVVVVYNMQREAPRTLRSLTAEYQRGIAADEYEVIVVENGSPAPLDAREVEALGPNFRYVPVVDAKPSPAPAVNLGIRQCRAELVCVMIDGARIATPGLLQTSIMATRLHPRAVVATLGFYLGHEMQRVSMLNGYTRQTEDALLASIDWPEDGYRLFEIGTFDESSLMGWNRPIAESNALTMQRAMWDEMGGMDERFDFPGGGLVNPDTFIRATDLPGAQLFMLLGEGTFHQLHGGIATNSPVEGWDEKSRPWFQQYEKLRGRPWALPQRNKTLVGSLPAPFVRRFVEWTLSPPPFPIPVSHIDPDVE